MQEIPLCLCAAVRPDGICDFQLVALGQKVAVGAHIGVERVAVKSAESLLKLGERIALSAVLHQRERGKHGQRRHKRRLAL